MPGSHGQDSSHIVATNINIADTQTHLDTQSNVARMSDNLVFEVIAPEAASKSFPVVPQFSPSPLQVPTDIPIHYSTTIPAINEETVSVEEACHNDSVIPESLIHITGTQPLVDSMIYDKSETSKTGIDKSQTDTLIPVNVPPPATSKDTILIDEAYLSDSHTSEAPIHTSITQPLPDTMTDDKSETSKSGREFSKTHIYSQLDRQSSEATIPTETRSGNMTMDQSMPSHYIPATIPMATSMAAPYIPESRTHFISEPSNPVRLNSGTLSAIETAPGNISMGIPTTSGSMYILIPLKYLNLSDKVQNFAYQLSLLLTLVLTIPLWQHPQ